MFAKTMARAAATLALFASLAVSSQAFAQSAPTAPPVKVFTSWLQKDTFAVKFVGPTFSSTYEVNPTKGYTMFYGWEGQVGTWCARGKIPTTFTLGDDGKLTLAFKFNHSDCPTIKYEFDQAVGPSGKVYLKEGDGWTLRPAKVELVGYDVAEYREAQQQALAKANTDSAPCADGDLLCAAKKAAEAVKPALGTVVKP
jgi:hypothetical protein